MDSDTSTGPSPTVITFTAYGIPIQQGSTRAFVVRRKDDPSKHRAVITSDTRRDLKNWRAKIASAAQAQSNGRLFTGPVRFSVEFFLPRPKSLKKSIYHVLTMPDLSKLVRAAEDALKGIVWLDDKQIVDFDRVRKRYVADERETPRAVFRIAELNPLDWNERTV